MHFLPTLRRWFFSHLSIQARKRRSCYRPAVEVMEDRLAPANLAPLTPTVLEPTTNGVVVSPFDTHMVIGNFTDPDPGDTHLASDWEIWTTGANAEAVWAANGVTDSVLKFHVHLADGSFINALAGRHELNNDVDYRLQVRVKDSSGEAATQWSPWSSRFFHTEPALQPIPSAGTWLVAQPGYKVESFATGFQLPVNIAFAPNPGAHHDDPFFYVTELYGQIKVVLKDGDVRTYASGLLNFNPNGQFPGSGEQGVSGIVVDPATGDLFVSLLYDGGTEHFPKVVRFHSNDGGLTAATQTTILDMPNEAMGQSHFISNLTIGPDGKLYVHVGDGFEHAVAQDLDSFRGKILRLNFDGSAPSDNPFYNAANGINARDYIYTSGYRNPFGGAWRDADGKHYVVENGPSIDRFSQVVPGRNYLWDGTDASMLNHSIYNWNPAHAPVNIAFIQNSSFGGSLFPAAKQGHAFVAESGPTFASGPQALGKRISEWVLDANGNLVQGPTDLVVYNGTGKGTVVALAAGPDGLYFSDLYADNSPNPVAFGANVLRVRYIGTAPPVAPVNVDADAISGSQIEVHWTDASDNEDGFRVEQSLDGVTFVEIATADANHDHFHVTVLSPGVTYFFRVRGFSNDLGHGSYSSVASATTQGSLGLPSVPGNVVATPGSGQIALTWNASAGAVSYNVFRSLISGGQGTTPIATGIVGRSFVDSGLANGTTYYYTIAGVNGVGTSNQSEETSAAPVTPPPAPSVNIAASNGQVSLTWTASAGATSYRVYRGTTSGGQAGTPIATGLVATSFNDTGVLNGTTYYYKVSAVNGIAETLSGEVSATPTAPAINAHINFQPADAPVPAGYFADTGAVYANRGNGFTYGWSANTAADSRDRNDPLSSDQRYDTLIHINGTYWEIAVPNGSYNVHLVAGDPSYFDSVYKLTLEGILAIDGVPTDAGRWLEATLSVTVTDGNLTVGTANGGANNKIAFIDIVSAGPAVPAAPTGLSATPGNGQVALSWNAVGGATSYKVYRGTTSGGQSATALATIASGTAYVDTTVINGNAYFYKVSAVNGVGESPLSSEATATPTVPTPPPAPAFLNATPGNAQVTLGWTGSAGAATYNIYRATTTNGQGATPIATGIANTEYIDAAVLNGTSYFYKVSAVNAAGEGTRSVEASATPVAPTTPLSPTGLVATTGTGQVSLVWNASTGAAAYNVYRGTSSNGQAAQAIITGLTSPAYVDSAVTPGTTYYYKVTAVNDIGESLRSSEAFATPSAPPAFQAHINFQPATAPVHAGYLADGGAVFANRGNGFTYGWNTNGTGEARDRNSAFSPDQRYDTFIHVGGAVWEILVPNGTYNVRVVAGDPDYLDSNHRINAEGVLAVNGIPTDAARWVEGTINVAVTDGRLTLTGAADAFNAKISFIDIASAGPAAPAAPTGLAAAPGNAQVSLSWSAVAGATSYRVYRATTSNGQGATPLATGLTSSAYVDTTAVNGTTYYYKVSAVNAVGEGPRSSEASAQPSAPALPVAPTGLNAAPGVSQVSLTWNTVASATSYRVYRSTTSNGQGATPLVSGLTSPAYLDATAVNGTTYYYKITAVNAVGEGPRSTESSATPAAAPAVNIKINFQPAGAPIPAGYQADTGAVFGNHGNGYSYGWNTNNAGNARDRNSAGAPDQRYDTLTHFAGRTWEIALPNGTYSVRMVVGDPDYVDSVYRINAEGALVLSGTPTAGMRFLDVTSNVTVSDGKLTIATGSGASNAKINFIDIVSVAPAAPAAAMGITAKAASSPTQLTAAPPAKTTGTTTPAISKPAAKAAPTPAKKAPVKKK